MAIFPTQQFHWRQQRNPKKRTKTFFLKREQREQSFKEKHKIFSFLNLMQKTITRTTFIASFSIGLSSLSKCPRHRRSFCGDCWSVLPLLFSLPPPSLPLLLRERRQNCCSRLCSRTFTSKLLSLMMKLLRLISSDDKFCCLFFGLWCKYQKRYNFISLKISEKI